VRDFSPDLEFMKAWKVDTQEAVTLEYLQSIGVLHWRLDPSPENATLAKIRNEKNFISTEVVIADVQNNEEKVKNFFAEHLPKTEEGQFFLEGNGNFDVREKNEWIRIHGEPGDLIILPAGKPHRYSSDGKNLAKIMVLSQENLDSSGRINVVVENPLDFDRVVSSLEKTTKTLLFFTAARDPETKQPWCPDVRKAIPILEEILSAKTVKFYFVSFPIVREEYRNNPQHFYRVHEKIKLTKIPTLGWWEDGKMEKRLVEEELHVVENVRKFLEDIL